MAQMTVTVSPAGSVTVDIAGVKGGSCTKISEQIEIALGGAGVKSKKKKPEFFQNPSTATKEKLTF